MKMNRAAVAVPGIRKAVVSLNTCPVGAPPGMLTVSTLATGDSGLPTAPLYSVVTSAPLSETQTGVLGPRDIPHALTSDGSVSWATPGWSETRFSCTYPPAAAPAGAGPTASNPAMVRPPIAAIRPVITRLLTWAARAAASADNGYGRQRPPVSPGTACRSRISRGRYPA